MSPGTQIKVWRKLAGMTQEELAMAVGIGSAYMSNLERDIAPNKRSGIPRASESLCRRFARVLSVPEADVLHLYGYASAPREPQTVREFKARLAELGVHLETDDDVDDSPEALENLRHSLAAFLQAISKKK